ncbi:hypothetical protein NEOLEDRAFT_1178685 [Neolentinus lepideus HHB14362 ss-1]|uniref:Uncharacterized protein n=1 Tax=Neolentinus lepideus HHB14362 ss-1 TaxID=1314782 RepID=A0A165SB89_9AGAM|nr:hypothetical protein NEOLEDRAFT_1178685 [Neolentinus lepideus HHB14362 ss-1]
MAAFFSQAPMPDPHFNPPLLDNYIPVDDSMQVNALDNTNFEPVDMNNYMDIDAHPNALDHISTSITTNLIQIAADPSLMALNTLIMVCSDPFSSLPSSMRVAVTLDSWTTPTCDLQFLSDASALPSEPVPTSSVQEIPASQQPGGDITGPSSAADGGLVGIE